MALQPVCIINVAGLTPGHIGPRTPRIDEVAGQGVVAPLQGVTPGVTCPAQATILTGELPSSHGVVGNGWLYRDTAEVRFWQQSNRLIQGETLYAAARRIARQREEGFTSAKLFWWFNQGAPVDYSVTPKPHYGADGSKVFGIQGNPPELATGLEKRLGPFPFHTFWGPMAGLASSEWIAGAAADVIRTYHPTLTLVYLPHLDYDLQRYGPRSSATSDQVREVDQCVGRVTAAAKEAGAEVVILSEYGILPVSRYALPNRALREAGWLSVRDGPFGEMLDTFDSEAFAVTDHQAAHVYVREEAYLPKVADRLGSLPGVARVLDEAGKREVGLHHPRSGELVLLAEPDAWFAYPYWLDDGRAPDFARTVDIHRKPGYDPCELFFDPGLGRPKLQVARRLLKKKLGFRTLMDVIPLDPSLVGGSHGVPPKSDRDGPVFIASRAGPDGPPREMTAVKEWVLSLLFR